MRYESSYNARGKISAAQRLAEIACERVAELDGKSLGSKFWNHDDWKRPYSTQIRNANALLKIYEFEAIRRAWEANPRVRSLGAGFFREFVEIEQNRLEAEFKRAETAPIIKVSRTDEKPRPGLSNGRSARSKLRDL